MKDLLEATARAENEHFWFRGLRRIARQMIDRAVGPRRPLRVIDCGAGTGRNLDWLQDYGDAVGVELSPAGLAAARAHRRRVVGGTVTALPFADACADIATSFDVLYCLDDALETQALAEMRRVLRPGGVVLVNVAALDILHGSHSTLGGEVRRYTPARLRAPLERAGFAVERLTFTNTTLFPPALLLRSWERWSGRSQTASDHDLRVPSAPVNAIFNAALAMEAGWLRLGNLPIGTSLMALARRQS